MVKDILSKLDIELQQEIASDRQVVYILVETRKLLESLPVRDGFESLDFYCNWAVHTQMDRASAKALVRKVDENFSKLLGSGLNEQDNNWLDAVLSLESFRTQFLKFLEAHGLPKEACSDRCWPTFLHFYSRVIQDCPLLCVCEDQSLTHVDKLVFTSLLVEEVSGGGASVSMRWDLSFKDKTFGRLTMDPNDSNELVLDIF